MKYCLLGSAVIVFAAASASAGDILPDFSSPGPWLGQSAMTSDFNAASNVAQIDWIVMPPGNYAGTAYAQLAQSVFGSTTTSSYLYAYQIQSNLQNLNTFSVPGSNVLNMGAVPNQTLDANGWGNFSLPGETQLGTNMPLQNPTSTQLNVNATWSFGPGLDTGTQSSILWYTSNTGPGYGQGSARDTIPPSPGRGTLPTPVPAPGAVLLGIFGLAGLVVRRRG